jgi:hypothetical protein
MVARKDTCLNYLRELYGDDPNELAKLKELASHELGAKGRDELLMKAMRGEKTDAPNATLASLPLTGGPSVEIQTTAAPPEGSSLGFEIIGVLAIAGIGGLIWLMKKKAFF